MKTNALTDQSIVLLSKVLDMRAAKEKVIASNIANAETPGYSPVKFSFEDQLRNAVSNNNFSLKTTHSSHIPLTPANLESIKGEVTVEKDTTGIGDLNGVSLEEEMIELSKNELLFETAAQLLSKKLSIRKYVISGGQ